MRAAAALLLCSALGASACGTKVVDPPAAADAAAPIDSGDAVAIDARSDVVAFDVGDTSDSATTHLEIRPTSAMLTIDAVSSPPTRASLDCHATLVHDDGTTEDVTSIATFAVDDPSLGTFTGATFLSEEKLTGRLGDVGLIRVSASGLVAAAKVIVVSEARDVDTFRFFFEAPFHVAPTPAAATLKFSTAAMSAGAHDVRVSVSNDPANPAGIDATTLVAKVAAMDAGDAKNGCPANPAKDTDGDGVLDTFIAVPAGVSICFAVTGRENDTVAAAPSAQLLDAFVDVMESPGTRQLDRRRVLFVVPKL